MPLQKFDTNSLPKYSTIDLPNVESNIKNLLQNNLQKIENTLSVRPYTWESLMQPLEDMNDDLNNYWSPIAHLHSVVESDFLREIYNKALPLITEYHSELSQNEKLYNAIVELSQSAQYPLLNEAQRKIIDNDIRDFKLAGINLTSAQKAELRAFHMRLTELTTQFSENLLDATDNWHLHIKDEQELAGLPTQALQSLRDNARAKSLEGFLINLNYPCYSIVMRYLNNRNIREELYTAYSTRASDQGPNAGKWDNSPIMDEILSVRQRMANLAGFPNYAAYSLSTKMANKTDDVLAFLYDLLALSKPIATEEMQELEMLAKRDGLDKLRVWDVAYYSEKLQQQKFSFSQEDVRPYFPINKVFHGMFEIIHRIFGITIRKQENVDVWHPDVEFFDVYDENNELCGGFYTDLYARSHKKEGAWMDDCRMRMIKPDGSIQLPVAYLTCNFMPPLNDKPGLLTHDDVLTLFHEFGHCLHHMLTKVNYPSVSGINGVAWDTVEFPSQLMEYFCWDKESLNLISGHYETNQPLPEKLYKNMVEAKHFQTGMHMVRQIELALFDFKIHLYYEPGKKKQIQQILDEARVETGVLPVPANNRFQNSFSHIFAGGYAAGYYSYKWAEVLSADAYSFFEEKGIYSREAGRSFKQNILEIGGVRDPMVSFTAFRGRPPKIDALLRYSGIQPRSTSAG